MHTAPLQLESRHFTCNGRGHWLLLLLLLRLLLLRLLRLLVPGRRLYSGASLGGEHWLLLLLLRLLLLRLLLLLVPGRRLYSDASLGRDLRSGRRPAHRPDYCHSLDVSVYKLPRHVLRQKVSRVVGARDLVELELLEPQPFLHP